MDRPTSISSMLAEARAEAAGTPGVASLERPSRPMTPTAETRAARGLYGQVLPASHFAASSLGGGVPRPTTSAGRPSTAARLAERAKPLMERLATPRDERSYDAAALRRKAPGAPALGAGFAPDPPRHAMAYDDEAEVLHPCIDSLQAAVNEVLFSLSKRPELDPIIRQAGATEAVLDVLRSGLRPYRAAAASAPAQPSSSATSAAPAAAAASGATAGDAAADSEDEAGNALAEAQGRPAPRFEFSRCPLDVVTLTYLAGAVKNSTNDAGNATAAVAMGAVPLLCAVIRAGARRVAALLGAAPGIAAVGEVLMAARAAADSEMMLNAVAALGNVAFASMGAEAPAGAVAGAAAGASDGAGPSAEPAVISTAARCVQRLLPLLLMQSSTEAQLEAVRAVANLGRHAGLRAQMVGAGVPAAVLELLAEQLGRGLRCIAAAELDGGGGTEPAADLPEHVGGLVYTAAGALVNLVADPAGRAQVRATVTMSASLAAAGGDQAGPDVMVRAADWSYWDIGRGDICEVLLQGLFNVVLGWEEGGPPRLTAGQAADLASFLQGVEEEEDARLTSGPEEGLPPQSPSLRALAARVAATVRAMIDADAVDASDD
ncbi:hypothetical protein FNF28_02107 [Cafeteria roenbergensis]|uniref:Armadillo repeat-containing domain-containing protein n=1 Tax=Cafeteria roenbergensis TaxID=33653 RepID=A0A5A8DVI9_CAFRO|nr:hypothetical protein FNF28_02107 [Cafeteria roenbergensis]